MGWVLEESGVVAWVLEVGRVVGWVMVGWAAVILP